MKLSYKLLFPLSVSTAAAAILTLSSCDSGPPDTGDTIPTELISRGFTLEELEADPTATANFPLSIISGDTIQFFDDGGFGPENFPLGTMVGETSGVLRQLDTGTLPLNESTYRWLFEPTDSEAIIRLSDFFGPLDSTGITDAFLEAVNAPNLASALADFEERVQTVVDLGQGLGSTADEIQGGDINSPVIRDALNLSGLLALEEVTINGVIAFDVAWIPNFANVQLTITSTNQDLLDTGTISGFYTVDHVWWQLIRERTDGGSVHSSASGTNNNTILTLAHAHTPNVIIYTPILDTQTGTFTITLSDLGL